MKLTDFRRVVLFTGAGMSAESGVPTYRGKGGIWKEYDYERCACQSAFEHDPELVWEFHNFRRQLVASCEPNAGHRLIAAAEARHPSVTVVTQNIDGLHQRAGSHDVIELHGSLWQTRCDRCGAREESRVEKLLDLQCRCGAYKRPDIVWFGDMLSETVLSRAVAAISSADLFVSVGTSALVHPAAQLPGVARRAGARLVEVNLEDTPLSHLYDDRRRGPASQVLGELWEELPNETAP